MSSVETKNVRIVGGGVIEGHLDSRGVARPFRGVLVPDRINSITGLPEPIVRYTGTRGGPGFLCLDTIRFYESDIEEITD